MNSNSAKEVFKDIANIFYKLFTSLALKTTYVGEKLFTRQYTASVFVIMVYFLLWILQTLSQQPLTNISSFFPISLLLILGCVVSLLTLMLISQKVAIITLVLLCVIIFVVVVMFNNHQQELYKVLSMSRNREMIKCRCRTL